MNYPSIRIEGAILSPDILDRLEDAPGQRPADFGLDGGARVKDEIARAWADAQDYWRIFRRKLETLRPDSAATTETRQQWVVPLLGLLGYQLEYQSRGVELNGKTYAISHRVANRGQAPVHITGYREPSGLDRKPEKAVLRMSAHGMVQEYLTLAEELYGLVTNGRLLRLLRDSSRLVKLTYLEFDLDRIFTDGLFADFAVLYRLLHATRLPASQDAAAESLIERYHQDSLDSGSRIRDGLSRAVEQAIRDFANGFLAHPANEALRNAAASGELKPDVYYQHLLRLIYRLLFLMVIEERGLVFPPGRPPPSATLTTATTACNACAACPRSATSPTVATMTSGSPCGRRFTYSKPVGLVQKSVSLRWLVICSVPMLRVASPRPRPRLPRRRNPARQRPHPLHDQPYCPERSPAPAAQPESPARSRRGSFSASQEKAQQENDWRQSSRRFL